MSQKPERMNDMIHQNNKEVEKSQFKTILLRRQPSLRFFKPGLVITIIMLVLVVLGIFWTPFEPDAMQAELRLAPASFTHVFGTDQFGRDVFSRVLVGARSSLLVAFGTTLLASFIGILIGGVTGFYGKWVDEGLMRINDVLFALPPILIALVVISLRGNGLWQITLALGLAFIPSYARMVRGEFLKQRAMDYVTMATLWGVGSLRLMFVHILPNIRPVLYASFIIGLNNALLAEAGLSYMGLGIAPPQASLGRMLSESQGFITNAPHLAIFPGLFLVLLLLGFGMLGEGMLARLQAGGGVAR